MMRLQMAKSQVVIMKSLVTIIAAHPHQQPEPKSQQQKVQLQSLSSAFISNLPSPSGDTTTSESQQLQLQQRRLFGSKAHKRKGFLATLKMRLSKKARESHGVAGCSHDLSSSVIEEDNEEVTNTSDSVSTCSGRSSCCTEQSYQLSGWKGTLSASWQSLTAATSSNLMVPASSTGNEDASSLSEASGISLSSVSGVVTGTPPGGKKNPTALILEVIDDHGLVVHYLIPEQLAKKGRILRGKGTKLHVCQDHLFVAKHIKR